MYPGHDLTHIQINHRSAGKDGVQAGIQLLVTEVDI